MHGVCLDVASVHRPRAVLEDQERNACAYDFQALTDPCEDLFNAIIDQKVTHPKALRSGQAHCAQGEGEGAEPGPRSWAVVEEVPEKVRETPAGQEAD